MASDATVAEITEPDIPEVAGFLARQVRPGEAVSASPLPPERRLRWLLLENPAHAPGIPLGWCIRNTSGTVVGAAICSPFVVGAAGLTFTALMFSKFFVDPTYRGMGLGLLMRFVREGARFPLFVTSTNKVAGELFARVGASVIPGMDHTMLGTFALGPLAEEWIYRRFSSAVLARTAAAPAYLLRGWTSRALRWFAKGELIEIPNADAAAALNLPPPGDAIAIIRNHNYLHWRYFTGESDKHVYCLRIPGETDRLVVVNLLRSGYRRQIRVLNVLDVWPPTTSAVIWPLVMHLQLRYRNEFDALWLRSQPADVEAVLQKESWRRHSFPAPLGWYIDREKRLPTDKWYIMPGESE